ncbi:MAG: hypothetical protein J2P47_08820, partial [Acetobacteraceae bacterium]|nr:hypothetical protein [Acetobacteraceae bacterium]
RFDAALLGQAERQGVRVLRGAKATALGPDGTVSVRTNLARHSEDGGLDRLVGAGDDKQETDERVRGDAVLLATGKHDLRGARRAASDPGWVGLKTYLRLTPSETGRLRGAVEIVLFPDGYAGLLLVEGETANLSLIVRAARLARLGGWNGLYAALVAASAHLAARLRDAETLLARPLAVSRVPYGFLHRPSRADPSFLYRLGDQAAVIPSFTGDGVAIALESGARAARAVLAGEAATIHHARLRRMLSPQMCCAGMVQALCAGAWTQAPLAAFCRTAPSVMRATARWTRLAACEGKHGT